MNQYNVMFMRLFKRTNEHKFLTSKSICNAAFLFITPSNPLKIQAFPLLQSRPNQNTNKSSTSLDYKICPEVEHQIPSFTKGTIKTTKQPTTANAQPHQPKPKPYNYVLRHKPDETREEIRCGTRLNFRGNLGYDFHHPMRWKFH